jgi:hypothetical protein
MSEAQIGARAGLYVNSATQAYEKGRTAAYGLRLEQHPGDGQTPCLASCKCSLEIEETDAEWRVWWRLSSSEHCSGCKDQAAAWNPLVVSKDGERMPVARRNGKHAACGH